MKKNQILVSYSLIFCPICLQENNTREGNVSVISNGAARSLLHKTARTPAPYNQSEDSGPGRSRVRGSTNQGQFLDPQCPFPAVAFRSGCPRQLLSVGLTEEVVWFQNGVCMPLLETGAWAVNTGNDVLSLSVTFQHQAAATLRVSLALVQHCVTRSHLTSTNVSCTFNFTLL